MDTVSGVLRQVSQERYAFGMVEAAVSPQNFRAYLGRVLNNRGSDDGGPET